MKLRDFTPPKQIAHAAMPPTSQAPSLQLAHSAKPVVLRDRLIALEPTVCDLAGVKKSTIYTWLADPKSDFPRPVRLGTRMVRFSEVAVLQWVQNRINGAVDTSAQSGVQK